MTVNFNLAGTTATDPDDYALGAGTNITNLTANTLTIVQGTGVYANDAIIQVTGIQEYLARLAGIDASSLTQESFL